MEQITTVLIDMLYWLYLTWQSTRPNATSATSTIKQSCDGVAAHFSLDIHIYSIIRLLGSVELLRIGTTRKMENCKTGIHDSDKTDPWGICLSDYHTSKPVTWAHSRIIRVSELIATGTKSHKTIGTVAGKSVLLAGMNMVEMATMVLRGHL